MTGDWNGTGAVVLAAGESSRLGQPKQFVYHEGQTLLERTLAAVTEAIKGPVVVVTGRDHAAIAEALALEDSPQISLVRNESWIEGIGTSLACGVRWLMRRHPDLHRILLTVCDQPHLTAAVLRDLVALQSNGNHPAAFSAYEGTIGPPACIGRGTFSDFAGLTGNRGAKALFGNCIDTLPTVPFPLGGVDLDTPEDLEALLHHQTHQ